MAEVSKSVAIFNIPTENNCIYKPKACKTSQILLWDNTLELYEKLPLFAQQQLKTRAPYTSCDKELVAVLLISF